MSEAKKHENRAGGSGPVKPEILGVAHAPIKSV